MSNSIFTLTINSRSVYDEERYSKSLIDALYLNLQKRSLPFIPILAGGSLRNWHIGKEANDLDVYIKVDDLGECDTYNCFIHNSHSILSPYFSHPRHMGDDSYVSDKNKFKVYELLDISDNAPLGKLNLQFIYHTYNNIEEVLNTFPVSISQIAYDPSRNCIIRSTDYDYSFKTRIARVYGYDNMTKAVNDNKYIRKIYSYHKEYSFIANENFPELSYNFPYLSTDNNNTLSSKIYTEDTIDMDSYKEFMRSL